MRPWCKSGKKPCKSSNRVLKLDRPTHGWPRLWQEELKGDLDVHRKFVPKSKLGHMLGNKTTQFNFLAHIVVSLVI